MAAFPPPMPPETPPDNDGLQSLRDRLTGARRRDPGDLAGQLVFRGLLDGTCELWRGSGEHVRDVADATVEAVLATAAEDAERTGFAPSVLLVDQTLVAPLQEALRGTPTAARARNDAQLFSASKPKQRVEIPRDAKVKIVGLQNAADLNGCSATVQRFDAKAGRYRVQLDGEARCARVKPANLLQLLEVVHVADGAFGRIRDKALNGEETQPGARHGYLVNGGAPIFGATDIKSFWACEDTCVPVGTCVRVAYADPAWDEYDQALVERVDMGRRRYVLRGADGERKVEVAFGAVRV